MADNLISLASQYLTPDMIGKLAGVRCESTANTTSLVTAASPMLLAGMARGSTPGGMDALVKAMGPTGAAYSSVLDGLGGTMAALASGGGSKLFRKHDRKKSSILRIKCSSRLIKSRLS